MQIKRQIYKLFVNSGLFSYLVMHFSDPHCLKKTESLTIHSHKIPHTVKPHIRFTTNPFLNKEVACTLIIVVALMRIPDCSMSFNPLLFNVIKSLTACSISFDNLLFNANDSLTVYVINSFTVQCHLIPHCSISFDRSLFNVI